MLAILGGTGPEGKGLALRLALAGEPVTIGSRSTERGAAAATELAEGAPGASIAGTDNAGAAAEGDVVFLAFPYEGQRPVLEELARSLDGKIVVSVIAPMAFERGKGARAVEVEAGLGRAGGPGDPAQRADRCRIPECECRGAAGHSGGHAG